MNKFTGNKDVDYLILLNLSDKDLGHFCRINSYAKNLCKNENLWREKTINRFGAILGSKEEIVKDKGEESWRNFYVRLVDLLEYLYNMENFHDDLITVKSFLEPRFLISDRKLRKDIKKLMKHVNEESYKFSQEILKNSEWEKSFVKNDFIKPIIFTQILGEMDPNKRYMLLHKILSIKDKKIRPRLINILFKDVSYEPLFIKLFLDDERTNPNLVLRDYLFQDALNIYVHPDTLDMVSNDRRINSESLVRVLKQGIGNWIVDINILQKYLQKLKELGANKEIFIRFLVENNVEVNEKDDIDELINKIIKFNKEL